MKCKDCEMWVEEDIDYDYSHEEALKLNKGFCLCQDLFTHKEPDDECDDDFTLDNKNEKKQSLGI